MAQAVQKQQELLERLREESAAKDGLALELHKAKGECNRRGRARLRRPTSAVLGLGADMTFPPET